MSVRKPIGNITAYAAAVKGGYTGTYEQFCEDQAKFADNAAQVRKDAESAAKSANEARDIAESIYTRQIAPPLELLQTAIVLTTPTLAMIASEA